jgi:hypothetical protein
MKNPIFRNGLFHTPTLEELEERIQGLPAKESAMVNLYVMMTLNTCHALVEEAIEDSKGAYAAGFEEGFEDGYDNCLMNNVARKEFDK